LIVLVIFDREESGWPKSISKFYIRQRLASNQPGRFSSIQYIKISFILQELWILLGWCLTSEELVGVTHWRRWGWNYEDCLQRLTERTFYEVDTLSGLPFLKILSVLSRSSGRAF
jgi:hypothetical protein